MTYLDATKIGNKEMFALLASAIGILSLGTDLNLLHSAYELVHPELITTYLIQLLTPSIGLVFGLIGLKSQLKKYAITAAIFCALPLGIFAYFYLSALSGLSIF